MKTAVVYYSLEGNTEYAAGKIAAALGAGLLRIRPEKDYPVSGPAKFLRGGKSAVLEETPKLEPSGFDPREYDRVILGFPVWAGNIAPPMRTFLKENDLKGTRLAAFVCKAGPGAGKVFSRLKVCLGTDTLDAETVLIDPKKRPGEENERLMDEFCRQLG